ncbi:MAG: GNAT family N-acetyltransferase [Flavobacteriales bacterium]|nr:GNAT family N-acetyltransferase [Flavobacteriales bacterium]
MLVGENIRLRALEPEDLDLFYKWENDSSIWKISQTYKPFSRYLLKQYLENAHQDIFTVKQLRLMIEREGVAIGTIDLFDYEPMHARAGLGIWIVQESNRRQGYAKEALRLIIEYAFFKLQLNQLYCNISANNQASINLFSSLDFVLIGVKKKWNKSPNGWEDELMFQLLCE